MKVYQGWCCGDESVMSDRGSEDNYLLCNDDNRRVYILEEGVPAVPLKKKAFKLRLGRRVK